MEPLSNYKGYSIRIKPECREKYIYHHANIWKEVEDTMKDAGVVDYKIYMAEDCQLFAIIAFREGCDMHSLIEANNRVDKCIEWDELMSSMQIPCGFAKTGEWWAELDKVYDMSRGE